MTIAMMTIGMMAHAQDSTETELLNVIRHSQSVYTTANDSTALAVTPDGVAIVHEGAAVGIAVTPKGVFMIMKTHDDKGISISADGKVIFLNADTIIFARKTFSSHADADAALQVGEEYFLTGDRLVYRKPQ